VSFFAAVRCQAGRAIEGREDEQMKFRGRASRKWTVGLAAAAMLAVAAPVAVAAFNPVVEQENYSKLQERQTIYTTPQYQALLAQVSTQNTADALAIKTKDPERQFYTDVCWNDGSGCAGDARLYDWGPKGYGMVRPVLFTARDGATISGHVWATRAGPRTRPAIVITDGSVQADEQMYWYAAQALAKAGYVVLTFDPQGQGQSDTYGEAPDANEGVPAQSDGRPFFDGTEDALNFLLSTQSRPYEPVASCNTGTSHAAKQNRRVKAGLDAAYNPFWKLVNSSEIGLAGHSYGAAGVSYIGQWDRRVKAVVAWDNLGPGSPSGPEFNGMHVGEKGCVNPANRTTVGLHTPALGMSADYFLPPTPNASQPDPTLKSAESFDYTRAGVDTGELIIRGGSHLDFSWIPFPPTYTNGLPFGATLRGADMIAWYTTAWFNKYLKRSCTADEELLTQRWRNDGPEAAIDPGHDGNMFSFYYPSRLDIRLANHKRYDDENLRSVTRGLKYNDGYNGMYSYLYVDRSPDVASTDFGACPAAKTTNRTKTKANAKAKPKPKSHPTFTG
jgi:dienelactone hydrolase